MQTTKSSLCFSAGVPHPQLSSRSNGLFLRAMVKIMTQNEVITELIIYLKASAAIFWGFRQQTSHL